MKKDTHPQYNTKATITCACGATYTVGSTEEKMEVEVCGSCHPFYTGDTSTKKAAGRVERFKARSAVAKAMADKRGVAKAKYEKKAEKRAQKKEKEEKTGKA